MENHSVDVRPRAERLRRRVFVVPRHSRTDFRGVNPELDRDFAETRLIG